MHELAEELKEGGPRSETVVRFRTPEARWMARDAGYMP